MFIKLIKQRNLCEVLPFCGRKLPNGLDFGAKIDDRWSGFDWKHLLRNLLDIMRLDSMKGHHWKERAGFKMLPLVRICCLLLFTCLFWTTILFTIWVKRRQSINLWLVTSIVSHFGSWHVGDNCLISVYIFGHNRLSQSIFALNWRLFDCVFCWRPLL